MCRVLLLLLLLQYFLQQRRDVVTPEGQARHASVVAPSHPFSDLDDLAHTPEKIV